MPDPDNLRNFPDITSKLSAPAKKTAYERKKADEEAKRQREAAETQAALAAFRESLGGDDDDNNSSGAYPHQQQHGAYGAGGYGGAPKRYFAPGKERASGPGTLGPLPPLGAKKRGFDGGFAHPGGQASLLSYDDGARHSSVAEALNYEPDQEERSVAAEKAAPKPTVQLANLPPGMRDAEIRRLLPADLAVFKVAIAPAVSSGSRDRRSDTAIITFTEDTPAKDLDTAVNTLQNRYLGFGHYLSISRYLSSAALSSSLHTAVSSSSSAQPFGAIRVQTGPGPSLSRAPPPQTYGAVPPPRNYRQHPNSGPPGPEQYQVPVIPPSDITQLRIIHKTVECVLTHGEEFEALMMSIPEVQKDEKWAWLFDPRSTGGVWYRWRLWEAISGSFADKRRPRHTYFKDPELVQVFDDGVPWQKPREPLPFEFVSNFDDLVVDSDYSTDSGESEDDDEKTEPAGLNEEPAFLSPIDKAKLAYFLAELPPSTTRLCKSDIATITWFVVNHADRGADEIAQMIVSNIDQPFALMKKEGDDPSGPTTTSTDPTSQGPGLGPDPSNGDDKDHPQEKEDPSPAKLVALHLLSDILFASSSSGIRGAWRYRTIFESLLFNRATFVQLGRLDRELAWGKMKADKWRRAVDLVLSMWEGQNVFSAERARLFREQFENPPLTAGEKEVEAREEARKKEAVRKSKFLTGSRPETAERGDESAKLSEVVDYDWDPAVTPDISDASDTSDEGIDGEPMPDSEDEEPRKESTRSGGEEQAKEANEGAEDQKPKTVLSFAQRMQAALEKSAAEKERKAREAEAEAEASANDVDMFAPEA